LDDENIVKKRISLT